MVITRNGLVGVLALCGVACGDGGGGEDREPAVQSALITQAEPEGAVVEQGEDLSGQWGGRNGWNGNGWNGWGSRPTTPSAPGGGAWDPASVSQWCFLLGREAEFLCKVTFADCKDPQDLFTQILCQLRGLSGGNPPSTPTGGSNPPRDDDDAWGDDLADPDGDNRRPGPGSDRDTSDGDDEGDEWSNSGPPGLGG